ncbi:putative periplasmic serine endoprotease DegP-like precursor [Gemmata obscuriglobus]|uniref:Serine endoprotease n=1 Tax=Gemmata obscuriglobus TaxID=114 RepID=A0A2Z3GYN1_9BACT|nr:trypsin-like peptidase domain-containing protein [Gemmata obscuriglobus]AWM38873.1 serine endoprotease [Gemmata obscuriglobus]QEG28125.1 putative periplasmic serine endoprotease DegP-like precursor [Gemmata obscuriglobus]VTS05783.1 peptidase s1 and s6 chymotrypsin hap : Peptidase S1 and S6 chymotrypsin/Hap OS=Planctomyces limnophilus (strain ATCC 43296 / DSM 3776 / IFAM 1008 / 290) GN=Plim_1379 PE=4 SV=1: Trypsin_2: PDZ_2 [Gemmata obscuriglobus UQM 2246]
MRNKVLFATVCAAFAFLGGAAAESLVRGERASAQPGDAAVAPHDRFQNIIKHFSSSVVAVDAVKPAAPGSTKSDPVEESGSGVIVKFPGAAGVVVVSNYHVVGAAAPSKVYVTLSDGRIVQPARIWADPESDLSFLNIEDDSLPAATLADSSRVKRGQWVLAFGSPFGLNQTVTHGIISATDRGQISLGSTIRIKEFLQTDAAINPGSSGGPLVDLDGKVVGINTAIASKSGSSSGVSFSIPANLVKRIAGQLIEKGTVTRGYLGVQLASALEPAEALRLGLSRVSGALVEIVHPNTPAAAAGLRVGDVILQIEDVTLRDENHLINLVSALPPGQKVRLSVWRDRKAVALEVTVGQFAGQTSRSNRP